MGQRLCPAMGWFQWALLSAFFAGATAVLAKAGVTGVDPDVATAIRTTIVPVIVWGIALAAGKPSGMTAYPATRAFSAGSVAGRRKSESPNVWLLISEMCP